MLGRLAVVPDRAMYRSGGSRGEYWRAVLDADELDVVARGRLPAVPGQGAVS
jgi:hypothetical protein